MTLMCHETRLWVGPGGIWISTCPPVDIFPLHLEGMREIRTAYWNLKCEQWVWSPGLEAQCKTHKKCKQTYWLLWLPSLSFRVKLGLTGSWLGKAKEKRCPLAKSSLSTAVTVWITCCSETHLISGTLVTDCIQDKELIYCLTHASWLVAHNWSFNLQTTGLVSFSLCNTRISEQFDLCRIASKHDRSAFTATSLPLVSACSS